MQDNPRYRVRVFVQSEYLPEQSDPEGHRWVFAYHVTIRNEGEVAAKLLTRDVTPKLGWRHPHTLVQHGPPQIDVQIKRQTQQKQPDSDPDASARPSPAEPQAHK